MRHRAAGRSPPTFGASREFDRCPFPHCGVHLRHSGGSPNRSLSALLRQGLLNDPDGSGIAACLELKTRIENELRADFLLIDSGNGVTELAGVTTTVLADTVVCLMLANRESQLGARAVLRSLRHAARLAGQAAIEVVPVLSRVPEHDETRTRETLLHALLHVWDVLAGRLPMSHTLTDLPLVFLPGVLTVESDF
jgi:hypothetical protein